MARLERRCKLQLEPHRVTNLTSKRRWIHAGALWAPAHSHGDQESGDGVRATWRAQGSVVHLIENTKSSSLACPIATIGTRNTIRILIRCTSTPWRAPGPRGRGPRFLISMRMAGCPERPCMFQRR